MNVISEHVDRMLSVMGLPASGPHPGRIKQDPSLPCALLLSLGLS